MIQSMAIEREAGVKIQLCITPVRWFEIVRTSSYHNVMVSVAVRAGYRCN